MNNCSQTTYDLYRFWTPGAHLKTSDLIYNFKVRVERDTTDRPIPRRAHNLGTMMDMALRIRPWLYPVPREEPGAVQLAPVEHAMDCVPGTVHVRACRRIVTHGCDLVAAELNRVLPVGIVDPGAAGTTARLLKLSRQLIVAAVLGQPGHGQSVKLAAAREGLDDGVATVAARVDLDWQFGGERSGTDGCGEAGEGRVVEEAEEAPESERVDDEFLGYDDVDGHGRLEAGLAGALGVVGATAVVASHQADEAAARRLGSRRSEQLLV
jgi:hypothetical protein